MKRKIGLFFLSLWLLFVMTIIITIDVPVCFSGNCEFVGAKILLRNNVIPIICCIAIVIGVLAFFDFKFQVNGTPELPFKITEIESIEYEHLTFLTTYIVPLVCFNFDSQRYQLVLLLILIVIGVIYIRTDLFYANPTLAILRFKIFKVEGEFRKDGSRSGIILITKDQLQKGDFVKYLKLDSRIYYAHKTTQND